MDDVVYGILDVQSVFSVDHKQEAVKVFKTGDSAHPGVQKLFSRLSTNQGGSVQVLNRFKASSNTCPHDASEHLHLSGTKVRALLRDGQCPPVEFTRPEVAEVLIEGMKEPKYQV